MRRGPKGAAQFEHRAPAFALHAQPEGLLRAGAGAGGAKHQWIAGGAMPASAGAAWRPRVALN